MSFRHQLYSSVAATAMAALAMGLPAVGNAQEAEVTIGQHGIGGVVTGPNGPEAGVWVIAETTDLPTKFAKIVVTDDQGRYLIPDLPPSIGTRCSRSHPRASFRVRSGARTCRTT